MNGGPGNRTAGLGTCRFETCEAAATEVVRGVPVAPQGTGRDVIDAAERITKVGLVVCAEHAPFARSLAGL